MSNSNVLARLTRGATRVARRIRMRHQKHSPRLGRELFDRPLKPRCCSGRTTLGEPEQFVAMATGATETYWQSWRNNKGVHLLVPRERGGVSEPHGRRARRSIGRRRPSEAPALSSRSKRLSANLRAQKKARHHQRNCGVRVPNSWDRLAGGTDISRWLIYVSFEGRCAAWRLPIRSA